MTCDLSEIEVQHVTARAGLSRSTFYLHFSGGDALRESVLSQLIIEITSGGDALVDQVDPDLVRRQRDWHDSLFTKIASRPQLFGRLMSQSGPGSFAEQLRQHHELGLVQLWQHMNYQQSPDGMPLGIWARFAADGLNGMIRYWLESGMTETADTLAIWIWNLCFPLHKVSSETDSATS